MFQVIPFSVGFGTNVAFMLLPFIQIRHLMNFHMFFKITFLGKFSVTLTAIVRLKPEMHFNVVDQIPTLRALFRTSFKLAFVKNSIPFGVFSFVGDLLNILV